ncbi:MAG TPA: hypothetical protein VK036_01710, partial [Wenzhouxiangella sp.]|nr:hypothetical protein [Wenzhouxiangella sp.]
ELSGLSAAREVEVRNARVTVFPSGRGNLFQEVSGLINDRGWKVHQLQYEPGRLDEVFRTITRPEAA